MPQVSVIVTTYNRKELLAETIQSILCQTFQDFELIVVDNFSNYDFQAHLQSFNSEKIVPFQNANDGVIAVNRNFALEKAKGKYVAFCDDDDYWEPDKLQRQLDRAVQSGAEMVAIYSNAVCFGEQVKSYSSNKKQIKTQEDLLLSPNIFFLLFVYYTSG